MMYAKRLALIIVAFTFQAQAETLQTGWMELRPGQLDKESGAHIYAVETIGDSETQVSVAIPKHRIRERDQIEEMVIIGQQREGRELTLPDIHYEWVADYDRDHYGLLIRFGERSRFPVRLFFKSEVGAQPKR